MSAWTELSEREYAEIWDRFCLRYEFKPSVRPNDWPGIRERAPSVTWAIPDPWSQAEIDDLHVRALAAFRTALPNDQAMFALDWQHTCWWFRPHDSDGTWEVPVLPNGDYCIFLEPQLDWGWFVSQVRRSRTAGARSPRTRC